MSKDKLFKVLELIIVIGLFLWAIYFSKDTLEKFFSKRTGFSTFKELRSDFPTTVLCFSPIAKESFTSQYNMTMKDFVNSWYSDSLYEVEFSEFKNAAYFILGKDYNISLLDNEDNEHVLKEGNNTINEIEVNKDRHKGKPIKMSQLFGGLLTLSFPTKETVGKFYLLNICL